MAVLADRRIDISAFHVTDPQWRRLRELASWSDAEFDECDLAELNLRCAVGLRGSEDLDIPACLARVDELTWAVLDGTRHYFPRYWRNPAEYGTESQFRILVMLTILQRDLEIGYEPELIEGDLDHTDSRNWFIHGPLFGVGGTCVSLPILFVAIGRRLGYPLHMVHAKEHIFVRWEEPGGERFNFEAAGRGFEARSDDYYLRGPKPLTERDLQTGQYLRNLSRREEVGVFFAERGCCWLDHWHFKAALGAFHLGREICGSGSRFASANSAVATVMLRLLTEPGWQAQEDWERWAEPQAHEEIARILRINERRERPAVDQLMTEMFASGELARL